jgi:endonuclease/exonuclease/phosphatase family metal-dependent hydrolase
MLLLLAVCGVVPLVAAPAASSSPHAALAPVRLKVMTFNIEYGGTVIDFDSIVRAVVKSDADVVGLNEAYSHTRRLAREAGYRYWNTRVDVVSRFPLLDPPQGEGRFLYAELAPGEVVAVANVHLPSSNYGPRRILDGWHKKKVLRTERRTRLPALRPVVHAVAPEVDSGITTFILGDFNSPSHQDWTTATVGSRPQLKWPVRWPVTEFLEGRDFVDTYRVAHPDPVADPGLTWPAKRPRSPDSWNPRKDAPQDRIDQIWVSGGAPTVLHSQIVGERGGPDVAIGVKPWGSDHRAVVSTIDLEGATPPVFVTAEPRLDDIGHRVLATYHAPGGAGERVVVVPAGGDPATDEIDSKPTPAGEPTDGDVFFPTSSWTAGGYDVVLVDGSSNELSRYGYWVREPGAPPVLDTDRWSYGVGDPITVTWQGAPGNRFDWLGVYVRDADPLVAYYKDYLYTKATVRGSATFDDGAHGRWPLLPGRYTIYYLLNDNYRQVAGTNFVIRA